MHTHATFLFDFGAALCSNLSAFFVDSHWLPRESCSQLSLARSRHFGRPIRKAGLSDWAAWLSYPPLVVLFEVPSTLAVHKWTVRVCTRQCRHRSARLPLQQEGAILLGFRVRYNYRGALAPGRRFALVRLLL